ncbi:hypothetical protein [Streptomyces sp. NPDC006631]|uniref:hypothetical protein n=1 Tax=Streptomyces sp. NPDC006631 TaxID=3364752 RepID=UPI0036C8673E
MGEKTRIPTAANLPKPTKWTESEARSALGKLRDALEHVGITVPSLDLDYRSPVSAAQGPLIELGRVRPDIAEELAEVIRRGAPLDAR